MRVSWDFRLLPEPEDADSFLHMEDRKRRRPKLRTIWRLILAAIGVIAVVKELQKPPEERTWHGKVGDFVPYEFRLPTIERVKSTYWNPEGPYLNSKVFGVGWAFNLGAFTRWFSGSDEPVAQPTEANVA